MNSSGKRTRSAPSPAASARALADLGGVALDVAQDGVELREGDGEDVW